MNNSNYSHLTRGEYLQQLAHRLNVLPETERQDALEYYDGYLSDAEDERAAMQQLGSPGEVASNILADYVSKQPSPAAYGRKSFKERRSGVKVAWAFIIGLFALPIGLPLIIVAATIPLVLFITLGTFVLTAAIGGVAFVISGIISLFATPFAFMQSASFGLITGGSGLLAIGLGILMARLVGVLMGGFSAIARFTSQKILKRRGHDGRFKTV